MPEPGRVKRREASWGTEGSGAKFTQSSPVLLPEVPLPGWLGEEKDGLASLEHPTQASRAPSRCSRSSPEARVSGPTRVNTCSFHILWAPVLNVGIQNRNTLSLVKVLGCSEQGQGTTVVMTTRNSGHTRQCLDICELTGLSSRQPLRQRLLPLLFFDLRLNITASKKTYPVFFGSIQAHRAHTAACGIE